jgi:hypothetical protein
MDQNISYVSDAVAHHSAWEELLLHHHMLGHMSFITLGQLYPNLHSRVDKGSLVCDACQYGKLTRSTNVHLIMEVLYHFKSSTLMFGDQVEFSPLIDIVHLSLLLIFALEPPWVYVLRNKNDVFECFRNFHNLIMTRYDS